MTKTLPQTPDRKTPDRKPPRSRPGSKPFAFDQHGDVVHLDDDCGATVHVADPLYLRGLAVSPSRRA